MLEYGIRSIEAITSLTISATALIVSIIALYYTVRAFLLKSGHRIRCDISTASTVECDDDYVSSITLENLKDRATVIFSIYLQLGRGNYLLLEDFGVKPLILKPFEVYHKEFDPLLFYSASLKRVKLDHLLNNRKIRRKILLSTTDGKYVVKTHTRKWSPTPEFFINYTTAIISPQRIEYKGEGYGSNVKFLVEFKNANLENSVLSFKEDDHCLKLFEDFQLTKESLKDANSLEEFFKDLKSKQTLNFDEIEIIDFQDQISKASQSYEMEPIDLEAKSFFKYNILGRILTIWENRKMKIENRKLKNNALNTVHKS